jgi:Tol biopolymer transport system component
MEAVHARNALFGVWPLWGGWSLALSCRLWAAAAGGAIGIFDGETDVGNPAKLGSARFDADQKSYRITGGGENMWFAADAFHFVWKRMAGDVSLAAAIEWPAAGGNAHRKACLLIRQSLKPDSAYVDAALHGDGLCSLQYREIDGAPTREIQSNVSGPSRIRIEKQGRVVTMSVARAGESLQSAGGSFKIEFREPFYVGLGVCAHDNRALETAVFSEVELVTLERFEMTNTVLESTLETVAIASRDRRVVYHARSHFEAPNWLPANRGFLFNSNGRIYTLAREGGTPELVDTGFANRCNNDHGISPDGTQLAISHHGAGGRSYIYVLPIAGGTPVRITPLGPSYWHGWSPDGTTLAYCAEREGNFDVYTIPASGGQEKRLTTAAGLDDGPEYSPDGQFLYFNSDRTGSMKIWRMRADGSAQEQVTFGELNDWFPHPSPDGKWIVFLSYEKGVQGHPANQDVQLRLLPVAGGEILDLAKLFGGQGTMNVPSWSPDSKNVAFVSYRLAPP